jgi:fatty-acyl-CoA synthase
MTLPHFAHWPTGSPKSFVPPATSLYANLTVSALRYPAKAATVFYDSVMTYGEFERQTLALAGWLQQVGGITKGDRVLLVMQNCPQFFVSFYAVLRADAVVVPVNPMMKGEEMAHFVADSGAKVAIAATETFGVMLPLLGTAQLQKIVAVRYSDALTAPTELQVPDFVADAPPAPEHAQVTPWKRPLEGHFQPSAHTAGPEDLCVMPYTSGTTGKPKGCMHPHRTVMFTAVAQCMWNYGHADAVSLLGLPLFHVTAMQGLMNAPIYSGSTVVIMPRWDRDVAGALFARYKVTHWTNIPTMVIDFLANPNLGKYDLSSLQRIGGGGASMPEAVAQRILDIWGLSYVEGYGLSETMAPTHINPPQRAKKQCLGIPIYDTDTRIVNPDTLEELGDTEQGEIIASGPQIFNGYWRDTEKTDAAFFMRDGKRFFRTGDLGYRDAEGYYFITDRLKRMINASGYKVWPAEVESMLFAHPDIQEACVIASRDAYRGETVKAVVVLKAASKAKLATGELSAETLMEWAKSRMAAYKYPRLVEFADALPKSPTGKVQWRLLQEKELAKAG